MGSDPRWIPVVALLAATCGPEASARNGSATHDALADAIDTYVEPLRADQAFSGAILVGTADSILLNRAYGWSSVSDSVRLEPTDRFRIASVSKTITAAAVQVLADRGALDLDGTLSEYLPGWEPAERMTIRHLLLHQSGVGNPDGEEAFTSAVDLNGLVRRITREPLRFEPGSSNQYSNAGYSLLAYVVEQASGLGYYEFLRSEIFEPLDMEATGPEPDLAAASGHALPHLPSPAGGVRPRLPDLGYSVGSGDLSSTTEDLYRWGRAVHENRLVDLDEQVANEWPYGWGKTESEDVPGVEQTGATVGFMSSLTVLEDGTIVVVLHNLENGNWARIGRDIVSIAHGVSVEPPERRASATPPADPDGFTGTFTDGDKDFTVRQEEDHLWLYFGTWPLGKWLAPIGGAEFAVPGDNGEIRFEDAGPDGYRTLVWDFGSSEMTLTRRD